MEQVTLPTIQPGSPSWYLMAAVLMGAGTLFLQIYVMVTRSRRETNADERTERKDAFAEARDSLKQSINMLCEDRDRAIARQAVLESKNDAQAVQIADLLVKIGNVEGKHEECECELAEVKKRLAVLERKKSRKPRKGHA